MAIVFQPGRYVGRVTGQGLGESKEKRTPFFGISVDIIGRVNPADPQGDLLSCAGGQRTIRLWLTEATAERSIEDLRRLGFAGTSFGHLDSSHWSIIGNEIEVYCSQEKDSRDPTQMQEKWGIARESGLKLEPLDQKGIKQLDNLFGKQLKAGAKRQATASPTAPPARETVPPDDGPDIGHVGAPGDDIPF